MMIKKIKKVMICIIVAALTMTQTPQIAKARSSSSSDNGDGTFTNPNVYLDVPDIDMIRVGENYYMVSTTMHMSPGCPILKSTDLVNWETVNYVFDRLTDSDAANLVFKTILVCQSAFVPGNTELLCTTSVLTLGCAFIVNT